MIEEHYLPLTLWVAERRSPGEKLLFGINGAQGTGKSTLADFLKLGLESGCQWRVAVLSIDDFYLTKAERHELSETIHPLLATRGVPGTHDMKLLSQSLDDLRALGEGERYRLPRFDKAQDDRADEQTWPSVTGPLDLVILEGWCVGSIAQDDSELAEPVNALERDEDPAGEWRRYVNDHLASDYADLFAQLDALVFLMAPGFEAIFRWRLEQEQKLVAAAPEDASSIMSEQRIEEFIQFYERITRDNLERLPGIADVVLELDESHDCVASRYRD